MKNYTVMMLGARGVGKTTLLTLVCDEMSKELEQFGFSVKMDKKTAEILAVKKEKIISMLEGAFEITNHLEGTDKYESYSIDLVHNQTDCVMVSLCFQDCPGGDLSDPHMRCTRLTKALLNARTIIYVVDTPYLIENGGEYNETVNCMEAVQEVILENRKKMKCRDLLIVPLKSEKYDSEQICKTIGLRMEKLLKALDSGKSIQVRILPVHTVGTVVFQRFMEDTEDGRPNAKYIRKYPNSKFLPQNIDLLSRHLLYGITSLTEKSGIFRRISSRKTENELTELHGHIKGMI